jgi:hypothetical protein
MSKLRNIVLGLIAGSLVLVALPVHAFEGFTVDEAQFQGFAKVLNVDEKEVKLEEGLHSTITDPKYAYETFEMESARWSHIYQASPITQHVGGHCRIANITDLLHTKALVMEVMASDRAASSELNISVLDQLDVKFINGSYDAQAMGQYVQNRKILAKLEYLNLLKQHLNHENATLGVHFVSSEDARPMGPFLALVGKYVIKEDQATAASRNLVEFLNANTTAHISLYRDPGARAATYSRDDIQFDEQAINCLRSWGVNAIPSADELNRLVKASFGKKDRLNLNAINNHLHEILNIKEEGKKGKLDDCMIGHTAIVKKGRKMELKLNCVVQTMADLEKHGDALRHLDNYHTLLIAYGLFRGNKIGDNGHMPDFKDVQLAYNAFVDDYLAHKESFITYVPKENMGIMTEAVKTIVGLALKPATKSVDKLEGTKAILQEVKGQIQGVLDTFLRNKVSVVLSLN